jgi:hypothetical protein
MPLGIPDGYLPGGTQYVNGGGVGAGAPPSHCAAKPKQVF